MDETISAIYQIGSWAIIGTLVLFVILRNYYPGVLDSIYGLLDRVLKGEPEIIAVTYLGTESRPARGSRGRVFFTAVTFGLLESLLVASLEGHDTYHRFLVCYENGEAKTVLCREDDPRYAELMSYVRWEDL